MPLAWIVQHLDLYLLGSKTPSDKISRNLKERYWFEFVRSLETWQACRQQIKEKTNYTIILASNCASSRLVRYYIKKS